jgi:Putative peptidoglycan binding domain/NlpC/P60 family
MVYAADLVGLLLRQTGDRYVFGRETATDDPDPEIFDCSELVEWGCARLGVTPRMPDGSWHQARHCRTHRTLTSLEDGRAVQGALLFRFSSDPFEGGRPAKAHVAVSLGNGSTIEARGSDWGVGSWEVDGRGWTHAGLVPGLDYGLPAEPPAPGGKPSPLPAWPGRFLTQPPAMRGDDVRRWQDAMVRSGAPIGADGVYGPESESACRELQREAGLRVDGIVGPATWTATFRLAARLGTAV